MRIGMIQFNPVVNDVWGNAQKILKNYLELVKKKVEIVVTSELAILGYPPRDLLNRRACIELQLKALDFLKGNVGNIPLVLGIADFNEEPFGKPLTNKLVVVQNGKIVFSQGKILLPEYDVFDEARYFQPNNRLPALFEFKGRKVAFLVCEDIWNGSENSNERRLYQRDPIKEVGRLNPDLLITINASPYFWGKGDIRFDLIESIAQQLWECSVVYVNQVGGNDELIFDGRSFALDCTGKCLAVAPPFKEASIVFDLESGIYTDYPSDNGNLHDLECALVMGIRDYFRKIGCRNGAVVGLSGGIDSALVAYLIKKALGTKKVSAVAMPSEFSSAKSLVLARTLAKNLGIKLWKMPINEVYDAYGKAFGSHVGWFLPGTKNGDVTEENVQARIRGNYLMAISNRLGKIVVSTGNKSELAVGYCTLYGDMTGGLAPISDLPKGLVFQLCRWINRKKEIIPWEIINRPPSAELRPGQKDQDTLPPYEILDPILALYIERELGVEEIVREGFDPKVVEWVVRRVDRNEFKRRQATVGIKITSKAFGTGRRLPIACKC